MENEDIIHKLENTGYVVREYKLAEAGGCINEEAVQQEINQILEDEFFYFVISFSFCDAIYKACVKTATKYVIGEKLEQADVRKNCFYVPWDCECIDKAEEIVFGNKELVIYDTIDELYQLHKKYHGPKVQLKELDGISDNAEIVRLTDCFFSLLEMEKELTFRLSEQLLKYIDELMEKKTIDSWREMVLWNKRHECRELMNRSWKFFLLQKTAAIFAEELIEYYEYGEMPSMLQRENFQELSETYFGLILLLRRLNYGVASEEEADIVDFIMQRKVSVIFIKHVIEHNQIENKEKVYKCLEELLMKYGQ